ncbi:hypothetical protein Nstercoris_00452 [Nitrosomonas stercoris]|uniref:Integrase catalytic domain-containing protein n=1 Tax=Nitrosomonas stercoris TaxID=1444684 RepID=A0A4Y1YMH2_9PROT|nr:hypothetical protein Nstercoris_00452 [Nitrosomonas stercoris]
MKKSKSTDIQILNILKRAECGTWLWTYNHERSNMANGELTPIQKLTKAA